MLRCGSAQFKLLVVLYLFPGLAFAGPGLIQYQGRLTNPSGTPITAATPITFTFWSAATGGNQLGGTYYDTDTVTPNSQGIYTTMIGDETGMKIPDAIFASPQVWLNVKIGNENLSPRKQMVATGYAFQSNWATTATTAISSKDTLAAVTGRGASTAKEVALGGGMKTNRISPLTPGGSVQVEGVYMVGGSLALPEIDPPASPANKVYQTSGTLYWSGHPVMLTKGESYIVVQTTSDPALNGRNLISAYALAKSIRPHGQDLATSNRLTVFLPPGRYQLDENKFRMNADFIDLIGLSSDRNDQYIYGNTNTFDGALVRQTANDVHLENLWIEAKCLIRRTYPPAAYCSSDNTTFTVIRNCKFIGKDEAIGMGITRPCAGYYENVETGNYGFAYMADASGKFVNCKAGKMSFGYTERASGTFIDCTGTDDAFGGMGTASGTFIRCAARNYSFAYEGIASGTFTDCVGDSQCFGKEGTASGTFIRCKSGMYGFAYGGAASGKFTDCTSGDISFGAYGTANGKFTNCTGIAFCFGFAATVSGTFKNCTAEGYSFGTGDYSVMAVNDGTFIDCVGGNSCFGAGGGGSTITVNNGLFVNCVGGDHSFGGQYASNASARLQGCRMTGTTWWGTWAGVMEDCRWGTGFTCAAAARIYNSTIDGTLNLNSTAVGVTHSRAKLFINEQNNVFGAAALNISNSNVR